MVRAASEMHASMKPNPNGIDKFLPHTGHRVSESRRLARAATAIRFQPLRAAHSIAITAAFGVKEIRVFDHAEHDKCVARRSAMRNR
jgi:methylthioribose-1-phosphate isomerase